MKTIDDIYTRVIGENEYNLVEKLVSDINEGRIQLSTSLYPYNKKDVMDVIEEFLNTYKVRKQSRVSYFLCKRAFEILVDAKLIIIARSEYADEDY